MIGLSRFSRTHRMINPGDKRFEGITMGLFQESLISSGQARRRIYTYTARIPLKTFKTVVSQIKEALRFDRVNLSGFLGWSWLIRDSTEAEVVLYFLNSTNQDLIKSSISKMMKMDFGSVFTESNIKNGPIIKIPKSKGTGWALVVEDGNDEPSLVLKAATAKKLSRQAQMLHVSWAEKEVKPRVTIQKIERKPKMPTQELKITCDTIDSVGLLKIILAACIPETKVFDIPLGMGLEKAIAVSIEHGQAKRESLITIHFPQGSVDINQQVSIQYQPLVV